MTTDTDTPTVAPTDVAAPNGSWPKDVPIYETTPAPVKPKRKRRTKAQMAAARAAEARKKEKKPKTQSSTTGATAASCVRPVEVTPAAVVEPSAGVRSFERMTWAKAAMRAIGLGPSEYEPDPVNAAMVQRHPNFFLYVGGAAAIALIVGAAWPFLQ